MTGYNFIQLMLSMFGTLAIGTAVFRPIQMVMEGNPAEFGFSFGLIVIGALILIIAFMCNKERMKILFGIDS